MENERKSAAPENAASGTRRPVAAERARTRPTGCRAKGPREIVHARASPSCVIRFGGRDRSHYVLRNPFERPVRTKKIQRRSRAPSHQRPAHYYARGYYNIIITIIIIITSRTRRSAQTRTWTRLLFVVRVFFIIIFFFFFPLFVYLSLLPLRRNARARALRPSL